MIPTVASASLGSICGISIFYWPGRRGRLSVIRRYAHRVRISPEEIEKVSLWLNRSGRWGGVIIGYFVPGVRHLTALVAGAAQLKYADFATFAYVGALLWSIIFITGGFFLEKEWLGISVVVHRIAIVTCASIAYLVLLSYLLDKKSQKN
jgi:membrane protein DedA with SNARE-associated domain